MSGSDSGLAQILADVEGLTLEPVVSTPAPAPRGKSTLGGGGGGKRLTSLYRSPSPFAVEARMGKIMMECNGIIGASGSRRFCLVQGCEVKHRGGIFEVPPNHLFIRASGSEAFCAPSVNAAKVSPSQLAEFLSVSKTVDEWVDLLTMLDASEAELTLEDLNVKLGFLDRARTHRTPAKIPPISPSAFESELEALMVDVPEEISHASSFPWSDILPPDFVSGIEMLGQSVTAIVSALPTALSDTSIRLAKSEGRLSELLDHLSARLLALEGTAGRRPNDCAEDLPPTVWDSVASLWLASSDPSLGSAGVTSADERSKLAEVIKLIEQIQCSGEEESRKLGEILRSHEKQASQLFKMLGDKLKEVVRVQNDLTQDLKDLSATGLAGPSPEAESGLGSLLASLGGSPSTESEDIESLKKEIQSLRRDLKQLKGDESDESVHIGGVTFHTKEDLRAWMLEHIPDGPFGSFVDFFSLLQQVDFDMNGYETNEEILKSLKLRNDLDISTNSDILALAALRNNIPPLLGRGKTPTSVDRSQFHAFHSFNEWKSNNNVDGLVQRLPSFLEGAKRAITLDISLRIEAGSVASLLAATCLSTSITFAEGFMTYITNTYEQLSKAAFSKAKAWALASALGARVCQEVHKDSGALLRSVNMAKGSADRENLCVLMLWATFRAHMVMEEYQRLEFKDHPSIASEYVKFLATNSGFEVVSSLEAKIDAINKEVAMVKKAATTAGNAAETAKNTANEAKKTADRALRQCPS